MRGPLHDWWQHFARYCPHVSVMTPRDRATPTGSNQLVFVCLDFYPDDQAASQLFTDLLVRLADAKTHITVLCGFPMGTTTGHNGPVPRHEVLSGVSIVRCGLQLNDKRKLAGRALLYASFVGHAAWKLLRIHRATLVLGVTSPPFSAHLLWATSLARRFSYTYMFLDVYPEALVSLGTLESGSFVTRLWKALSRLSYHRATKLAVLGRDMIPLLERNYGVDASSITYIPHWSAAEVEQPIPFSENSLAHQLGIENNFVVQYSGNMGLLHDIDALVRAAAELRDDTRIHFLFIGKGRRRRVAEQLAQDLGLQNITWLDFVPRERLRESLSCCHVALISLRQGMAGVAVPSKLYGILAMGRAVIAHVPSNSEIAFVVGEEQCGCVVGAGDIAGLVSAIRRLVDDPRLTEEMGHRSFAAYQSKYTTRQAVTAFRQLLGLQ